MIDKSILVSYLRQQKQLAMPDLIFNNKPDLDSLFGIPPKNAGKKPEIKKTFNNDSAQKSTPITPVTKMHPAGNQAASGTERISLASSLSSMKTIEHLMPSIKPRPARKSSAASAPAGESTLLTGVYNTYDEKRAALRMLYYAGCSSCGLAATRKSFVFGAGNADAPVMVIGEAPGSEEDDQGMPFVGPPGQLLTSMLSAIKLDKNKNVFITNVLKCRPPENRAPQSAEIVKCMPILEKQIAIIQPKAILLLGRIASHSVLGSTDTIANLRSKILKYKNSIPAMVIYHPAALLRNPEYKRPAWDDLQKFQSLLTDLGVYELSKV